MIIKCLPKTSPNGAPVPDIAEEAAASIVSYPSGDCPYYLLSIDPQVAADLGLLDEEVADTAAFFDQYDLTEETDDEEVI